MARIMTRLDAYEVICEEMAAMSDEEVVKWAASFSLTPKPDPDGESMGNFRKRVLDSLR